MDLQQLIKPSMLWLNIVNGMCKDSVDKGTWCHWGEWQLCPKTTKTLLLFSQMRWCWLGARVKYEKRIYFIEIVEMEIV